MTGYLHLPPLWVMDEFDHTDSTGNHVDQNVDIATADDIVCERAINDDIAVCFARDGFAAFIYGEDAEIGGTGAVPEMLADRL